MRVVLDLETTSTVDLRRTGAYAYAEHPDTRVTVACFAIDDGPVETWTEGPPPAAFVDAVKAGSTIVAHNYQFEHAICQGVLRRQGWPKICLEQWSCTMARCLVAGYPASLEAAGPAAGLPILKDHTARDLMLRFARPRSLEPLVWWHETDPVRYKRLQEYCARDVAVERELDRRIPELSRRERILFEIDHLINARGMPVDHALVSDLADVADIARDHLTRDIRKLTGGMVKSLNQVAQLRGWLGLQGVETDDLRRGTVVGLLADEHLNGPARVALQARLDASRSSTAKLTAISEAASRDGRVRGTFQYYGASRTGRWAGRRLQPQNLFRSVIKDVPGALKVIRAGAEPADLDMLFETGALGVVASCLRSTIQAPAGFHLAIADFSQIEARVLAWLAGQDDVLKVFADGKEDIYVATARKIGSPNRLLGKVLTLACGYGMGATKFQATALGYGLVLEAEEAERSVTLWREANPRIVNMWWELHKALMRVVRSPGASERCFHVELIRRPGALLIKLPSGRHLVYRKPHIQKNDKGYDEFCYQGAIGSTWTHMRSWPGKITENVTQAVARDIMAEAMIGLQDLPLIATIHDELIAEVAAAEADSTLERMLQVMRQTPAWAGGLPMNAAGVVASRYHK